MRRDTAELEAGLASDREMGRDELLRRYGIPRGTFLALRDAGGILPRPRRTKAGNGRLVWHEEDVDAWFSVLTQGAPKVDHISAGMTSLVGAGLRALTSVDVIVSSLLSGRIRARGIVAAQMPWPSIVLSVEEIRSLRAGGTVDGFLSKREVAVKLQSTHRIVDALIDQKHLAHTILTGSTGIPWVAVKIEDADAFACSYMPPRSAAWHVGTAVKTLRKRLGILDIDPAIDLKISKNSVFYCRPEVEQIEVGSLAIYK